MPLRDSKEGWLDKVKGSSSLEIGQVVKSKSGRDKDRIFLVFEILDSDYVTIVNGSLRGVERPKKKKIKHLMKYKAVHPDFYKPEETVRENNERIREYLMPYERKDHDQKRRN